MKIAKTAAIGWSLALALVSVTWAGERELRLDTTPSGARVEFGGSEIGVTPLVMTFPTAFFQAPQTIWARHLSAPLKINLSLEGYAAKTVELGEGPHSWASLNGANHFDYYLLKPSYTIKLDSAVSAPQAVPNPVAVADALEKLARLRQQGFLTDAEFQQQKQQLLGSAPSQTPPAGQKVGTDPNQFSSELFPLPSDGHRLDTASSALIPGAQGPIVRCLWMNPAPNVSALSFYVQCKIQDLAGACATIGGQPDSDSAAETTCHASLDSDLTYLFSNGCAVLVSGAGSADAVSALAAQLVTAFSRAHPSK